ncbi:unnamed protein product [Clavelina lepadiformis]|uniref:Dynactin subunit 1 n=1 Tax=Clavelina lepadiformis TaxID=159417 RepID=A0ABP0H1E7_CLALP
MSDGLKLGTEVEITGKGLNGVISYIGTTMFASGKWVGVTLDEPLGKNDGSVQGKRYFECPPNHGVFVRPPQVQAIETPKQVKKLGTELQVPSSVRKLSGGEQRSKSPSRPQSRLLAPSSLQRPKTGRSSLSSDSPVTRTPAEPLPVRKAEPEPEPEPAAREPETPTINSFSHSTLPTLAPGVSMVELDSLKGQLKEWKEKYETIRIKRQEDRGKLKEFEKMKIQIQHLNDGKARSSEQMQDLSKKLREAKKATEEAVESKDRYMEEMSDVHETIEMATLDKEMAEEKSDMLQKEVDNLKDRVEELQTDLEIMKAEIEDGGTEGAASNYQHKQLEDQNSRLKEALVRMRDLSAAEKVEYGKLEKDMEKKDKDIKELTHKKDKLSTQLEKAESTIDELKEQVDAALAAEEMVEELTDKNLEQEEKIIDLEEQLHDLESMNEMNEELQENARDTELELREELDMIRSKLNEAQMQTEAANEVVTDFQDTIQKFRKVVQELQEANEELRTAQSEQEEKSDVESETVVQHPAINYQIKMVETKAAARSIDHELRKLDVSQATLHAKLLSLFMPAMFTRRGGDNDCVQVLLLVERFASKAQIIAKHVTDKFDTTGEITVGKDLLGVRGDQLAFATSLVCRLKELQVLLERYNEALGKCSVERFQKIGTLYGEMKPHERILDYFSDLLRKDTLDETTNTSGLDKVIQFFKHLYNVHISKEEFDCTKIMEQYLDQSQATITSIVVNTSRLKSFLQHGQETSDVAILLKDMGTSCDDIKQFCRKVKRRMPQTTSGATATRLEFSREVKDQLCASLSNLSTVNDAACKWAMECSKVVVRTEGNQLRSRMMQELFNKSASEVFQGKDSLHDVVRITLGNVMASLNALVTAMQEGEYDTTTKMSKAHAPVEKRAQVVISELADSEGVSVKLLEKDEDINELRKLLKTKSDEVSESKIRIGMLERKLEKATKEGGEKTSYLQQRLDSMTEDLKKKEKEYDETLDALQNDIDTLEAEKAELKQRLSAHAKRGTLSDLGLRAPTLGATSPTTSSGIASILANAAASGSSITVSDSPMLTQQIQVLRSALRVKSTEYSHVMGQKMIEELQALTPLLCPKVNDKSKTEIQSLKSELTKLETTVNRFAIPQVIDISKRKPGAYPVGSATPYEKLHNQRWRLRVAADQLQDLKIKTQQVAAKTQCRQVQGDFASFPTPQSVKSLSESKPCVVGKLQLSMSPQSRMEAPSNSDIFLDFDQFKELHKLALHRSVP